MQAKNKDYTIPELMEMIVQQQEISQMAYKTYQQFRDAEYAIRDQLEAQLRATGLKSAKASDGTTATIAERKGIGITHEPSVMGWLKEQPNIEGDLYLTVRKREFGEFAKRWLKETGEVIPGTEMQVAEHLSIRKASNGKKS